MNTSGINERLKRIVTALKPWAFALVVVLILRYTGALAGISFIAQSAAMEAGIMNVDVPTNVEQEAFNYGFQLKDLEGNVIDAQSLQGKVLFINLWATWCGPCRVEMPSIQKLYDEKKDNVVFAMISLDQKSQHHKIKKYIDDKGFTFPVYTIEGPTTDQLYVPSIPTTLVIGKDGTIKSKKVGAANYNTKKFKSFLDELSGAKAKLNP
jgi:thiol-disulfide isomerase/thioredoxin